MPTTTPYGAPIGSVHPGSENLQTRPSSSGIEGEFEDLREQVMRLLDLQTDIEARLAPVLLVGAPLEKFGELPPQPVRSPVAQSINNCANDLRILRERWELVANRLNL